MEEGKPYRFFLIRYVPNVVRGEFVNIGVLVCDSSHDQKPVLRFTRDWSRLRCADKDVETAMLEVLEAEWNREFKVQTPAETESFLDMIQSSFSNSLQISEEKSVWAESIDNATSTLMDLYVLTRSKASV